MYVCIKQTSIYETVSVRQSRGLPSDVVVQPYTFADLRCSVAESCC